MFLFYKSLCYGVAFAGVFLTTIICISSDPCQELIILATIGNAEWRIMEASILEVMYPVENTLSLVKTKRRANTAFWLPFLLCFSHLSAYTVSVLSSWKTTYNFFLFRNCALWKFWQKKINGRNESHFFPFEIWKGFDHIFLLEEKNCFLNWGTSSF